MEQRPKVGSKWRAGQGQIFVVLEVVDIKDHTWVHYREKNTSKEYSCFLESFYSRFTETPNE
jgi:hypothetical protein